MFMSARGEVLVVYRVSWRTYVKVANLFLVFFLVEINPPSISRRLERRS